MGGVEIFLSFFPPVTIYFTIDVPPSFVSTVVNNIKSIERRIQVKEFYLTYKSVKLFNFQNCFCKRD